tara:strand:+ start:771 stop:1427 length:657 start_codon:yes stop_codon:yes gene_type:complete
MHNCLAKLQEIFQEIYSKDYSQNKSVKIIAVSKTFNMDKILPLIDGGHIHFGENKVQETQDKWPNILSKNNNIKLHMIGKLQTNKVKQAVKLFDYIHSVDSLKLAKKIDLEQKKINKNIKLFIQVNIDNEIQKSGILLNELENFHNELVNKMKMNVVGLMCIPSINSNKEITYEKMKKNNIKLGLSELSMGMSSDYQEAIKCGSTFLRIGSKIFGDRI